MGKIITPVPPRTTLITLVTVLLERVDPEDFCTITLSDLTAAMSEISTQDGTLNFRSKFPQLQESQKIGGKYTRMHLHAYAIRLVDFVLDYHEPIHRALLSSMGYIADLGD